MSRLVVKWRQVGLRRQIERAKKLVRWALDGTLRSNLILSKHYRIVQASGLFDEAFYRRKYSAYFDNNMDPLQHYLAEGSKAGFNPNPLFDTRWYLSHNQDVAQLDANPLVHYIQAGELERRSPHPLFDLTFYIDQRSAKTVEPQNHLLHYLVDGRNDQLAPHPLFSPSFYLERNPDVAAHNANPLIHYLESGWKEGRNPHPLFLNDYYLSSSPELIEQEINPLFHFVTEGFSRNPTPLFDCAFYLRTYADVCSSDSNPLIHYVLSGAAELRCPHPLFDPAYYLKEANKPSDGSVNALEDYLWFGKAEFISPHPLFDVDFYRKELGENEVALADVVAHYLNDGARAGLDPCELFDTSFYLHSYPDVTASKENPLLHYLRVGAVTGYNPNPLFDSAYYLKQNADVTAIKQNPLVHYIHSGAMEGRSPSSFFDARFYLRKNPHIRLRGINPLSHYLSGRGVEEGLDPNPFFSTNGYLREHPEVSENRVNPLVHFLASSHASNTIVIEQADTYPPQSQSVEIKVLSLKLNDSKSSASRPDSQTVLCVGHISPYSPRAGNEYRLNRLLKWFNFAGYRVIPIISPLDPDSISSEQIRTVAQDFDGAVLCKRTGQILCDLPDEETEALLSINGTKTPAYAEAFGENKLLNQRQQELLNIDRSFCHDALVHAVLTLIARTHPAIILVEYIFMSRFLPLVDKGTLKIIDTHDVFSSKRDKVVAFGVSDSLSLTEEEERERLERADLILAIQPAEQQLLERIVDHKKPVVTASVDFPIASTNALPASNKVLYVGSDNAMNVQGLRDFLRFVWPKVKDEIPNAELLVAGSVCRSVSFLPKGVELLGLVENLPHLYGRVKLTVNPAPAGTGLKIKTVEALSFLRPVVTWPAGIDGLPSELVRFCIVAKDWFEFALETIRLLGDEDVDWFGNEQAQQIRRLLSQEYVYASLDNAVARMTAKSGAAAV
jgi:hypothetical protein